VRRGNCYVTAEALFHLLGGKKQGWVSKRLRHEGDTHWFLVNTRTNQVVDPTAVQFRTKPQYAEAVGCGFLTKHPSKRAKALMETLVWQAA
jgi:hypothetical protein